MTAVALPRQGFINSWSERSRTPAHSFGSWAPVLSTYYERMFIADSEALKTCEAQLSLLSQQAMRAVRQRSRYYDEQLTNRLLESLSSLLNPEEFDGPVPTLDSLTTILRAVQIVGKPNVSIGADSGHFTAMWADEKRTVYVESLPNSQVRWGIAEESDDEMRTAGSDAGTLIELSGAFE